MQDEPGTCARKQGAQRMTGDMSIGHRSQPDLAPTGQIAKNFSIGMNTGGSGLCGPFNKIFHDSILIHIMNNLGVW